MNERQESVKKLINILNENSVLKDAVTSSLKSANYPSIQSLQDLYNYLDKILTHIPSEKELMPSVREFYYIFSKSPEDILKKDKIFNDWVNDFVRTRGDFLDTEASIETLETFINCPDYNISDYIKGPSGWMSYNQFLARELKPGKRPVHSRCDESIIVSPADSEFKGVWQISNDSMITVKGVEYSIEVLFGNSKYWPEFSEGMFTHSFLSITDYHRFHTPVGGFIREVSKIPANTWITEDLKPDSTLTNVDDVGFQFEHTRGFIIIESAIGLVAVMPVGMGHISSVNLTVEEGVTLAKGDEFGFFGFGGSDIIMLFQKDKVHLKTEVGKHYKQGVQIGNAIKV